MQTSTTLRPDTANLPGQTGDCETSLHAGLATLRSRDEDARGLLLVGIYKIVKVVFFCSLGLEALHLIHKNIGDEVLRITELLRLGPESHVVGFLLDKADLIGHHQLRQASMLAFGYAALCLVEGTGLLLRRVWAEYFTLLLTVLGLPLEGFELLEHFNWFKVGALVLNLLVLFYLLMVLKRKRQRDAM